MAWPVAGLLPKGSLGGGWNAGPMSHRDLTVLAAEVYMSPLTLKFEGVCDRDRVIGFDLSSATPP